MANGNVGAPHKEPEEQRNAPVTFRVTKEQRKLIDFLYAQCGYKTRGLFLYDLLLSVMAHEQFIINMPAESAKELQIEYRNSSTNLNQLKRDFYNKEEWLKDSAIEKEALVIELSEHFKLTKELYHSTFNRKLSQPVTDDFWKHLKQGRKIGNIELLPISQSLKDIQELKNKAA